MHGARMPLSLSPHCLSAPGELGLRKQNMRKVTLFHVNKALQPEMHLPSLIHPPFQSSQHQPLRILFPLSLGLDCFHEIGSCTQFLYKLISPLKKNPGQ